MLNKGKILRRSLKKMIKTMLFLDLRFSLWKSKEMGKGDEFRDGSVLSSKNIKNVINLSGSSA